jgi:hypothetical protein
VSLNIQNLTQERALPQVNLTTSYKTHESANHHVYLETGLSLTEQVKVVKQLNVSYLPIHALFLTVSYFNKTFIYNLRPIKTVTELLRMMSSGMLRRVALVRTDVSEDSCHPDEGGARFLRNVGSYKSHTA